MHPPPKPGDAFISAWSSSLAAEVELGALTLRSAIREPNALVHGHWPEHLLHDRARPILKLIHGSVLAAVLIARRGPLVLTMHNRQPHLGFRSFVDRTIYRLIIRRADHVVRLLDAADPEDGPWFTRPSTVIPLAPIDAPLDASPPPPPAPPVRLLHLGSISPYKCQVDVLEALEPRIRAGEVELTAVGRVLDDGVGARLRLAAERLDGFRLIAEHVDAERLETELRACHLTIGVQRDSYNSGVPATALPAGRPVVLTRGPQSRDHRRRFGTEWILQIDQPESPEEWVALLEGFSSPTGDPPKLSSLREMAEAHRALYEMLVR